MKRLILTGILAASSLAMASTWEFDAAHAEALFTVKHLMVTNVTGTLGAMTGSVELDDKDITKSTVQTSIDVKGINTKNVKRDDHLRSKDFFDVEKNPTVTFKSTKVEKASENKLKITGDLAMHGITKPVTLDAELSQEVENPFTKATTRAVAASATINRKDWGLVWNMPMANNGLVVGEDVKLTLNVELIKKGAAPAATPAKKK
jgi:polyisoprenoid-binding protein YceI